MIEQCENVLGELSHCEHWSTRNARKPAGRQSRSQFRTPVSAQVGNNDANPCELSHKRSPILMVERRGMKQNNRESLPRGQVVQPRTARKVFTVHARAYIRAHIRGGYAPGYGIVSSGKP